MSKRQVFPPEEKRECPPPEPESFSAKDGETVICEGSFALGATIPPETKTMTSRQSLNVIIALGVISISVMVGISVRTQAATQSTGFKEEIEVGGQTIVTTTDAQFLTVPLRARHARITIKNQPACWGANPSSAPTPTSGGEWPAGLVIKEENDRLMLANIRVISCAEGASTVKVQYFGDRRIGD